jgi:hypothetical protein
VKQEQEQSHRSRAHTRHTIHLPADLLSRSDAPRQSLNRNVKMEFRYGVCAFFATLLWITSPRADKLLLMACASFSLAPVAPDFPTRSLPARSTWKARSQERVRRRRRWRYSRAWNTQVRGAVGGTQKHEAHEARSHQMQHPTTRHACDEVLAVDMD